MKQLIFLFSFLLFFQAIEVHACDLCSLYTVSQRKRGEVGSIQTGLAHRFTHYESNVHQPGEEYLPGQHLESNITQLFLHSRFEEKFSFQFTLPMIHRKYRRVENQQVEYGSESGIGDLSALMKYELYHSVEEENNISWELFGGIKLPTGDSDRLHEEEEEGELQLFRHGLQEDGSLIGGDDLALGSGSYDWITGTQLYTSFGQIFLNGFVQYTFRQTGDHHFRYGDDLQWSVGPGYYLTYDHGNSIDLRLKLSGEWKEKDRLFGSRINGSQDQRVFLGPELNFIFDNNWHAQLGTDFAVHTESARDGITARYRVLASLVRSF